MLHVHNLQKRFGIASVLAGVHFILNDGEHVGLIGPNGAGKSTLLGCVAGVIEPDDGIVAFHPPAVRVGLLRQQWADQLDAPVQAVLDDAQRPLVAAEAEMLRASEALATAADLDEALRVYQHAYDRWEVLGGPEREQRLAEVLEGLGLGSVAAATPVGTLSGGQQTRLGLAALLVSNPDLLILDEPTNHLDMQAVEWLEDFLRGFRGSVLLASHDRAFLDRTVGRILYLDPLLHTVRSYAGNYAAWALAREKEQQALASEWHEQQEYVAAVTQDIRRVKGVASQIQDGPKRGRDFYGKVSAKLAKQARVRERKLERYLADPERVEKPRQQWEMKLDFGPPPQSGRAVLACEDLAFGYGEGTLLFRDAAFAVQYGERIAVVGPNGAGKSTLLRLIEGRLTPTAGRITIGTNVRIGVLRQEQSVLEPQRSVLETAMRARAMSETEARSFLHFFLFGGDRVFRAVGLCSQGEQTRLQLALLVLQGCNLLLLDEPMNHLDIPSREHLEEALERFEGTVIAVAHDRAFLRAFAERVVVVETGRVRVHEGPFEG
ncbi:MAG: ABC-F family ATP-binding cassette domain-containing protein [Herpetosiphon sp.]